MNNFLLGIIIVFFQTSSLNFRDIILQITLKSLMFYIKDLSNVDENTKFSSTDFYFSSTLSVVLKSKQLKAKDC